MSIIFPQPFYSHYAQWGLRLARIKEKIILKQEALASRHTYREKLAFKKINNVGLDYELVHWTVTWQFAKVIITINSRANNYHSSSTISSLIYSEILEADFLFLFFRYLVFLASLKTSILMTFIVLGIFVCVCVWESQTFQKAFLTLVKQCTEIQKVINLGHSSFHRAHQPGG